MTSHDDAPGICPQIDWKLLAHKLRDAGSYQCAGCGKIVSRSATPPFADCPDDCITVRVLQYAAKMETDMIDDA